MKVDASLLNKAIDFCYSNGIVLRIPSSPSNDNPKEDTEMSRRVMHAPFALHPTSFPRTCFLQAVKIQQEFNLLYQVVANDAEFIMNALNRYVGCVVDRATRVCMCIVWWKWIRLQSEFTIFTWSASVMASKRCCSLRRKKLKMRVEDPIGVVSLGLSPSR